MGARGPKSLPANVHRLRGNPSKLSAAELSVGLQPEDEIPSLPKHLLPEARKEWNRIARELKTYGVISKLDRAALALYVQEWAWLVWHETALQRDIGLVEARRAAFDADPANAGKTWTGGDGFMVETVNGNLTYNPHWVARNRHAAGVDKFQSSFGMSPAARGRVSPSSRQGELFDAGAPGAWNSL